MLLGFKTELKLNNTQRTILAKHAGTARHAWNQGLALTQAVLNHNQSHPDDKIKFPSAIDLHKCKESLDRDLNAALNIERFGLSLSS